MSELPSGWITTKLADVVAADAPIIYGILQPGPNLENGVPYVRPTEITDDVIDVGSLRRTSSEIADRYRRSTLKVGDILLSIVGTIGKVATVPGELNGANITQSSCRLRPDPDLILGDTLACFLRSPLASSQFEALSLGTAVPRLNLEDVRAIEIPLPPLAEQRRLVAKLDNLSAQSKRSRTHLDHVRRLVVKYKQAILAAAFRGDLTREWRVQHEDEPGPEARLKALHAERDGILGVHRRKSRTEDSGRIPMSLGILPERWATTTLEEITHPTRVIQYGILMPGPHVEGGVSYVKVMNIKGGRVQLERIRSTTPEIAHQYRRATILAGDILLTIRGTVGRLAIVPKELDGGNITQDTVRIVPLEGVEREFVFWYLHCPVVQQYFVRNQKGVAVRGINVGDVRLLEVPVPAREEQREIVKKIDAAFSWINRLSSDTLSARKLIDHLDQAVLAKAFQGELVPQDPSDEPASMLLERVTARRRAMPDLRDRNSEKRKTSRALRDA